MARNSASAIGEHTPSQPASPAGLKQPDRRNAASMIGMPPEAGNESRLPTVKSTPAAVFAQKQRRNDNKASAGSLRVPGASAHILGRRKMSSATGSGALGSHSEAPSTVDFRVSSVGERSAADGSAHEASRTSKSTAQSRLSSSQPAASLREPSEASSKTSKGSHRDECEETDSNGTVKAKDHVDMLNGSDTERGDTSGPDDDIFAPVDERVQTIDFSRIRTQSIQITKNEQKKKTNVLGSLKKQVKNFFHEDRVGQETDEQGNVELPMESCVQAREDHDSGLLPSQRLFQLARHEQLQLRDRRLQHQKPRHPHAQNESLDDYEFTWIVKRTAQSAPPSALKGGLDKPDAVVPPGIEEEAENEGRDETLKTTGNTYRSKVGSNTVDFQERIDTFLKPRKQESLTQRSEVNRETEEERARKTQLLSLCGLVAPPTQDALSPEERDELEALRRERTNDIADGADDDRYPCDCCGAKNASGVEATHRAARYYDLLFAHRKNKSFTVRFDLVHCLPRFVLHYKFHKQLYDCLDPFERQDLVKAAVDITTSYNVGNCTLQIPFGKYRTNAYPSFFAYVIVPNHERYLEIFEVCNPPVKPGERQKKNTCVIPNWPDKIYVTEFWTYSKESSNASDKDPRLTTGLYEKNVRRKLQLVQLPELKVTRRGPPPEIAQFSPYQPQQPRWRDLDRFEDFALILHHKQPMLGFGSVDHPTHAVEAVDKKSPKVDAEFLQRLLAAMCAYVRRHVNTRQRRLAGREELSCTVNLSLEHSYAFRGHQRVYGFLGFPRGSTYLEQQRRNATLAEAAVTHEDIRRLQKVAAVEHDSSNVGSGLRSHVQNDHQRGSGCTETSADRTEMAGEEAVDLREKLKSCNPL